MRSLVTNKPTYGISIVLVGVFVCMLETTAYTTAASSMFRMAAMTGPGLIVAVV